MKKLLKYALRIFVISCLHFYLKLYDRSFADDYFSLSSRSLTFYALCIVYSLIVWWACGKVFDRLNAKHKHDPDIRHSVLIYIASVGFGNLYYLMDTQIFGIWKWWYDFRGFDFDLNAGYFMFYSLIMGSTGLLFLFSQWKDSQIATEKLKKEYIQSKYEALKNQIDPHFFFNSLSVLTSLVYKDADLSAEYITKLSQLYRYIIDNRERYLVTIGEELEFLNNYMFLIGIRHSNSIRLVVSDSIASVKHLLLPPNTLQMLAENAVKHNKFSSENPLEIKLNAEGGYIVVRNKLDRRHNPTASTHMGLENISNRYKLLGSGDISISETHEEFIVRIPIIEDTEFEGNHS